MPGQSYTEFGDLIASVTQARYNDPNKLMNELQKQNYPITSRVFRGDSNRTLWAGKFMEYHMMTEALGNTKTVHPYEKTEWKTKDVTKKATVYHRFMQTDQNWTDQEIQINESGMTAKGYAAEMFRLASVKAQSMWTDHTHGFNTRMWSIPDKSTMESADGKEPYSLPVFVNEFTNGLFNYLGGSGLWTVIAGLDPVATPTWKCVQKQSTSTANDMWDVASKTSLFSMFDDVLPQVHFKPPGTKDQYFQNDEMYRQTVVTQRAGQRGYKDMLRRSQDLLVAGGRQDPGFFNPTIYGIPIEWEPELETATLYPGTGGTILTTFNNAAADDKGPRFYVLNLNYIGVMMHPSYVMEVIREFNLGPAGQANVHVIVAQTWWNLCPKSLRRQAIIFPDADQSAYN